MRIPFRRAADQHLGPLAEYAALRAEIIHLMDLQWKVTAFLITTSGAVFGFALTSAGRIPLLLIIPFSSNILASRWVGCSQHIERVSLYIRNELDPCVPGGIGYEKWLRRTPDEPLGIRRMIRYAQASPTGVIVPALAVAALGCVAWWFLRFGRAWSDPATTPGVVAWAAGAVLTLLSFRLLCVAANRRTVTDFLHWRPTAS
ncbi:hypothetical protein MUY14_45070 [Amycolatopsis sp. FBCC-B4732]|uniref:hypothetical protein n=1 Tax=Amycolatopsis sp. FBCC-B4732 TaxID=3079339 RepID=UPI001FF697D1|nr:hypothetical protein [Amycolatopsis sp. FBCC-B4732]UOX88764.1 hypothetical protein MUY14_45070 [Amycolatopsis sp. FBCC-B4732]